MDNLSKDFKLKLNENVSLKEITSVGIGGKAKYFLTVYTKDELKQAISISLSMNISFIVIGSGSNLLVSDDDLNILVIKNQTEYIEVKDGVVHALSGVLLQDLVNFTINNNLGGIQRLTGIPGTVGGAIFGNAGAYGQTISDHIIEVVVFDGFKELILTKVQCDFSYRESAFKKNKLVILEAKFNFKFGNSQTLNEECEGILAKRLQKYSPGMKCPGSFFKNILESEIPNNILKLLPPRTDTFGKIPAWLLLEGVNAKGDRLGDIQITKFHGNLFVNLGNGNAKDFWALAKKYYDLVKHKYGIELKPEVQLINLPSFK